ncbi:LLM class flavin-dependent oxidoreductase [Alkalicoccus daliensis]|uniref:Luciferase family oxidoreductase, group 1 n=1 Tax=Alkalicoccus daliensis TaxID=745820 RepID=A0A1H0FPM7_9BACI|nr:LLM class flavin-dependent oxidoreductase [Alkalicoccus daliensis]SDN96587.1 luciferase family oxidoreductase, group 1 [Alkalicoccus daliensis]
MKLGILDQVPRQEGASEQETIAHTIALARKAEKWGYHRYWFAEHHSSNGLLSAAPELWLSRVGAETSTIKIGSGGVLLPQYSPLKVAETFSTLASFYPDRVELGVGRSPGGSERTREALTDGGEKRFEEFPRQLDDLAGFLNDQLPRTHPYRIIKTTPRHAHAPPLWLLGLSPESGRHAGERGIGLVFGHFINPDKWEETLETYRQTFIPSAERNEPAVIVCVFAVCAETREEAEKLALTQDLWLQGIARGNTVIPSIEKAEKETLAPGQKEKIAQKRRRAVVGTPADIRKALEDLQEKYQTAEFLLINNTYGFAARKRSFELIAEEFHLQEQY